MRRGNATEPDDHLRGVRAQEPPAAGWVFGRVAECVELVVAHEGVGGAALGHRADDLQNPLDLGSAVDEVAQEQRAAVRSRNVLQLIEAGGNVYYLAKLAGIFGFNVQDIGAQQTGMSVEAFKQKLVAAGR